MVVAVVVGLLVPPAPAPPWIAVAAANGACASVVGAAVAARV
jgi:hypothetical protein